MIPKIGQGYQGYTEIMGLGRKWIIEEADIERMSSMLASFSCIKLSQRMDGIFSKLNPKLVFDNRVGDSIHKWIEKILENCNRSPWGMETFLDQVWISASVSEAEALADMISDLHGLSISPLSLWKVANILERAHLDQAVVHEAFRRQYTPFDKDINSQFDRGLIRCALDLLASDAVPSVIRFVQDLLTHIESESGDHEEVQRWLDKNAPNWRDAPYNNPQAYEAARNFHVLIIFKSIDYPRTYNCDVQLWQMWSDGDPVPVDDYTGVSLNDIATWLQYWLTKVADQMIEARNRVTIEVALPDALIGHGVDEWSFEEGDLLGEQYITVVRPRRRLQKKLRWPLWDEKVDQLDLRHGVSEEVIEWVEGEEEPDWEHLRSMLSPHSTTDPKQVLIFTRPLNPSWLPSLVKLLLITGTSYVLWPREASTVCAGRAHFACLLQCEAPDNRHPWEHVPMKALKQRNAARSWKSTLLWDNSKFRPPVEEDTEGFPIQCLVVP